MAKMTRGRLLATLEFLVEEYEDDAEEGHKKADEALLEFINDEEVTKMFGRVCKMYDV